MANNPWWPRADNTIQRAPEDGGSILAGYPPKGLWHTTETAGWPGYGSGSFPHLTVMVGPGEQFVARQHIPFTRAARALRNPAGGVQTNRIVRCQVEIVTFADVVDDHGLHPAMTDGLADLAVWLEGEWGVPRTCGVTFKPYPDSFGADNGVRLTFHAWEQYTGWLGHQHAAENDHGDPGALDWRPILQPTEADMPLTDVEIEAIVDRWHAKYGQRLAQWIAGKANTVYNATAEGINPPATHADLDALAAKVDQDHLQIKAQLREVKEAVDGLALGRLEGDFDVAGLLHATAAPPPPPPP